MGRPPLENVEHMCTTAPSPEDTASERAMLEEREAVVAWLRTQEGYIEGISWAAEQIEMGWHRQ